MATLYSQKDANVRKTWVFMTFFLALVVAIGWAVSYYYQSPAFLYGAFAFALFMNFFSYWFSDRIVLSLHKAKPVTREEHFDLWNITENLAITAGLPMPKLYVVEDGAPNAFATGRNKDHAVVCVTTGLLELLDRSELEGVIAHELSHIGNRDILLSTVAVVLAGFIALLSDMFLHSSAFRGRDDGRNNNGIIVIVGLALAILAPIAATLMQLAISRKREFLADASGALLTRYPEGLANALRKISSAAIPMRTANNATAHLFISNPFGRSASTLKGLFLTHPPVEDRIRALMNGNGSR